MSVCEYEYHLQRLTEPARSHVGYRVVPLFRCALIVSEQREFDKITRPLFPQPVASVYPILCLIQAVGLASPHVVNVEDFTLLTNGQGRDAP